MRIFGSEVHDTAFVFIMTVSLQCLVGSLVYGHPDVTISRVIVVVAAVMAATYWYLVYNHPTPPENEDHP